MRGRKGNTQSYCEGLDRGMLMKLGKKFPMFVVSLTLEMLPFLALLE